MTDRIKQHSRMQRESLYIRECIVLTGMVRFGNDKHQYEMIS